MARGCRTWFQSFLCLGLMVPWYRVSYMFTSGVGYLEILQFGLSRDTARWSVMGYCKVVCQGVL